MHSQSLNTDKNRAPFNCCPNCSSHETPTVLIKADKVNVFCILICSFNKDPGLPGLSSAALHYT